MNELACGHAVSLDQTRQRERVRRCVFLVLAALMVLLLVSLFLGSRGGVEAVGESEAETGAPLSEK